MVIKHKTLSLHDDSRQTQPQLNPGHQRRAASSKILSPTEPPRSIASSKKELQRRSLLKKSLSFIRRDEAKTLKYKSMNFQPTQSLLPEGECRSSLWEEAGKVARLSSMLGEMEASYRRDSLDTMEVLTTIKKTTEELLQSSADHKGSSRSGELKPSRGGCKVPKQKTKSKKPIQKTTSMPVTFPDLTKKKPIQKTASLPQRTSPVPSRRESSLSALPRTSRHDRKLRYSKSPPSVRRSNSTSRLRQADAKDTEAPRQRRRERRRISPNKQPLSSSRRSRSWTNLQEMISTDLPVASYHDNSNKTPSQAGGEGQEDQETRRERRKSRHYRRGDRSHSIVQETQNLMKLSSSRSTSVPDLTKLVAAEHRSSTPNAKEIKCLDGENLEAGLQTQSQHAATVSSSHSDRKKASAAPSSKPQMMKHRASSVSVVLPFAESIPKHYKRKGTFEGMPYNVAFADLYDDDHSLTSSDVHHQGEVRAA